MRRTATRIAKRIAPLGLLLALAGCGYNTWWNPPLTSGSNPNLPVDPSENMTRVMGGVAAETPLLPEPGDIWPGKIASEPTLQDMENDQSNGAPGSDQTLSPAGFVQPKLPPLPQMVSPVAPATPTGNAGTSAGAAAVGAPAARESGQTYQTPQGPVVTTGGAGGYQTGTTPGGGQAIIVPNGNGTSTIIHADGTLETVPTPK